MNQALTGAAVTFAVVLPTLLVAHNVADHWVQTSRQAIRKGHAGWVGRRACAGHVASYTLVTAASVAAMWWLFRLPISPAGFVAGQAVSAVTHYWADRRGTLAALARLAGKGEFWTLGAPRPVKALTQDNQLVSLWDMNGFEVPAIDNPTLGTGAYALDQSWHWLWLAVAAVGTAVA
ncbi:MAG TPA: transcriptional regulator [Pseudonocardiaceae bacterium]|jgi:hypothetical protein|nr:transcriptional regulator [Pseudonocardiaceae bacterium]